MSRILQFRIAVSLLCAALALGSTAASAQRSTENQSPDPYDLEFVRRAVKDPAMTLGLSFTETQINRMGDRLAIALIKIYSDKELIDPSNVRRYLPLLRAAFVAPHIVPDKSDRAPAITRMLLRRLDDASIDEDERREVRAVLQFVEASEKNQ